MIIENLLFIKTFLWIFIFAGLFLFIYSSHFFPRGANHKEYLRRKAFKSIVFGFFGLCIFPFLSTIVIGLTSGLSAEDKLSFIASKSPLYGLPDWALYLSFVLLFAILGAAIWLHHKQHPKQDD